MCQVPFLYLSVTEWRRVLENSLRDKLGLKRCIVVFWRVSREKIVAYESGVYCEQGGDK